MFPECELQLAGALRASNRVAPEASIDPQGGMVDPLGWNGGLRLVDFA